MKLDRYRILVPAWCTGLVLFFAAACSNAPDSISRSNLVLEQSDLDDLIRSRDPSEVLHLELGGDLSRIELESLLLLPNLESVFIYGAKSVDRFAVQAKRLRKVRSIEIQGSDLTDEGLQAILELESLRELRVSENGVWLSRQVVEQIEASRSKSFAVLQLDVRFSDERSPRN